MSNNFDYDVRHIVMCFGNTGDTFVGCEVFRSMLQKYSSLQGICGDARFRGMFVVFVLSLGRKCDISEKNCVKRLESFI